MTSFPWFPGAVTIDLPTGGIYGDLDHCPREDLLESAQALLDIVPPSKRGVRDIYGIHKSYGPEWGLLSGNAKARERYFANLWYEPLIGSIRDWVVTPDIEGIPNLTAEGYAAHKARQAEYEQGAAGRAEEAVKYKARQAENQRRAKEKEVEKTEAQRKLF